MVLDYITARYAAEYAPLNAVYRERNGVDLPSHDNYAPLTVKPMQAKAGEMVDPVSGGVVAAGGGYTPGSLRTRSRIAQAEPEFRDALQTFLAHKRQINHWLAYGDFAADAQAVFGNRDLMNAVQAKGGEEAVTVLRKWVDLFTQGGVRDASAGIAFSRATQRVTSRAATIQLVGNVGTRLIQSLQYFAAIHSMPIGSYLKRVVKLHTGQLNFWAEAFNSEFIQRRLREGPPVVRQAVQGILASKPNRLKFEIARFGKTIGASDALFTAVTYSIAKDFHMAKGREMGFSGPELDAYATAEAVRATEKVAQPTRAGTRSLTELTGSAPMRIFWSYASEARQKIALAAWDISKWKQDPKQAARTAFLVWGIGGFMSQLIRNTWRDIKDDDDDEWFDEKNWSLKRLMLATIAGPLNGIPVFGQAVEDLAGGLTKSPTPEGNLLSGVGRAADSTFNLVSGKPFSDDEPVEETFKTLNAILSGLGFINDTAAAVSATGTLITDAVKVLDALHDDTDETAAKRDRANARLLKAEDERKKAALTELQRTAAEDRRSASHVRSVQRREQRAAPLRQKEGTE
jgi:hypothetical protein